MKKRTGLAIFAAMMLCGYVTTPRTPLMETELTQPIPLTELDYLALTVWAEARGEGVQGMTHVASVIMNRVKSGKFGGHTIQGVVTKKKQFSCWNPGDPNRSKLTIEHMNSLPQNSPDGKAWVHAVMAARLATTFKGDVTKGALYYHTHAVNPSWAAKMQTTAIIGNHVFLV